VKFRVAGDDLRLRGRSVAHNQDVAGSIPAPMPGNLSERQKALVHLLDARLWFRWFPAQCRRFSFFVPTRRVSPQLTQFPRLAFYLAQSGQMRRYE
jgi:hypothetical protein